MAAFEKRVAFLFEGRNKDEKSMWDIVKRIISCWLFDR
jgi:hypothetical protein